MFPSLRHRNRQHERMDAPDVDPRELRRSLRFIRRVNSLLGYTRATLWHLERFSRSWKPGERIHLIDLATGSADVPLAILRWGDRRGFDLRIVGVELHEVTAAEAMNAARGDARLQMVRGDVLRIPFEDRSFDYALTALFLHHLDDDIAVQVLRTMDRLARRGVIVSDLLRQYRAYAWVKMLTFFSDPIVKNDAAVSVAQSFTKHEALALRDRAGLTYAQYFHHFGHRFTLAGQKSPDGTHFPR